MLLGTDFVITDYWVLFDFVNYRNSKPLHICGIHLDFSKITLNFEVTFLRFLENLCFFILCFGLKEICAVRCSRSLLGTLRNIYYKTFFFEELFNAFYFCRCLRGSYVSFHENKKALSRFYKKYFLWKNWLKVFPFPCDDMSPFFTVVPL